MTIAEQIINFRVVNGLSQQEFADRVGVHKSTISHLETNENYPCSPMLKKRLAYVFMGGVIRKKKNKKGEQAK